MFEAFSSGYYLGRLYVEAHDGDRALMQRRQHEQVNEAIYAEGSDSTPDDGPLLMKLDTRHFPVEGERGVDIDTLSVPRDWLPPRVKTHRPNPVLIAKADRARQLTSLLSFEDDTIPSVDGTDPFTPDALSRTRSFRPN